MTLALALVVALAAAAHLDAVAGLAPWVDDGALVGGGTTWGVVLQDDDLVFRRVCEESIGEKPKFLHRTRDGRVLVGSSHGLLVTTDGGCTYAPLSGPLGEAAVAALAAAPDDPARLAVVTASVGGGNGLYVSADEGLTFTAARVDAGDLLIASVTLGPEGFVVAAGVSPSTGAPFAWASVDDVVFAEAVGDTAPWPAGATLVRALGVAGDGRPVLGIVDAMGGGRLLLAAADLASAEEAATFDAAPTAYAEHAGVRFVAVSGTTLFQQEAGDGGQGFTAVADAPAKCLVHVPDDPRLWACGQLRDGAHFLATQDGAVWESFLPFGLVVDRRCPDGTIGQTACAYTFTDAGAAAPFDAGAVDDAGTGDVEPPRPRDPSCGCGAPSAALALLAGLRLRGRGRRPRS